MLSPLLNLGNLVYSQQWPTVKNNPMAGQRRHTGTEDVGDKYTKGAYSHLDKMKNDQTSDEKEAEEDRLQKEKWAAFDRERAAAADDTNKLSELYAKMAGRDKQFLAGPISYPSNIGTGSSNSPLPFIRYRPYDYHWRGKLESSSITRNNSIYLPMTSTVTQNTNPNWSQEEDFLSRFSVGVGEGRGTIDSLKNFRNNLIGAAVPKMGGSIASGLSTAMGLPDVTKATLRMAGVNYNPFHERFFDGVSFRVYSFEHKFMPEDNIECIQVSRLIKRFQFYSLPNLIANRLFMTYPSLWRIGFFEPDCNRNKFLPILEDCVITLVGVVYGGGGSWQDLANGSPVETTLSLQVTETTIPTKQRMQKEELQYQYGSEGVRENLNIDDTAGGKYKDRAKELGSKLT
jgi:hypothetical protein